jgi:SsrA-binding protein
MKVVAKNRRARFDYEILETVEAGIVLTGQEVKSARGGGMNLSGAYVSFLGGKPVLKQAKILPYKYASGLESYDPGCDRPLLLRKSEANRLLGKAAEKGLTVLPLEVRSGRTVKVLLGVGRGRKKGDKRARIREREVLRRLRRGEEV